jgi:hypothetical protein
MTRRLAASSFVRQHSHSEIGGNSAPPKDATHSREPDEPARHIHADKPPKGSGPNFVDLESQAEGAGRQSGLHGHLGNAWLINSNSRATELVFGDLRPDFSEEADADGRKQRS